jgi:ABC-2 type transport system permease protein
MGWEFHLGRGAAFLVLFASGIAMAYGFLLMLTSASVWLTRNQSLYEMWWLFTTLMRHPREIFAGTWATPAGLFFSFVVPIMLVTNVPARTLVRALDPVLAGYALASSAGIVVLSRFVFRAALARYRSASS